MSFTIQNNTLIAFYLSVNSHIKLLKVYIEFILTVYDEARSGENIIYDLHLNM